MKCCENCSFQEKKITPGRRDIYACEGRNCLITTELSKQLHISVGTAMTIVREWWERPCAENGCPLFKQQEDQE